MRTRSPCGFLMKPTSFERMCRARSRWDQELIWGGGAPIDAQTSAFARAVDLLTLPSHAAAAPGLTSSVLAAQECRDVELARVDVRVAIGRVQCIGVDLGQILDATAGRSAVATDWRRASA